MSNRPVDILLVEDNPGDVRLTQEAFKEARVLNRIRVATDGEEALAVLRRQGRFSNEPLPDIILLDLNLPKKSGRDVLAEIKSDPALARIPVVVLTSSQAEEDVARSYDLHANCFVTKPIDFDRFLETVKVIEQFWLVVVTLPPEWKG